MNSRGRQIIYIDATPILAERLSGIGHLTLQMIRGLLNHSTEFDIRLLVPFKKVSYVKHWNLEACGVVKIPLPARVWNRLPLIHLAPPIDIFLKKGLYIFPNFKAWPLLRSKSITYIHDISFELFPEYTEERNLKALKRGVPGWVGKSSLIVTDSNSSKSEIVRQYSLDQDKVKVVYCGVDGNIFKPASVREIRSVMEKYEIKSKYFMFLSNLEPRKNIERLVQSFSHLPIEMKKEYGLLLVGGMGWRNEKIIKLINKLQQQGCSIIKPKVYVPDEDIPVLLSGADALLHPAIHEGFGIPAIEAMSCGTPVITSDIPVMREVCGDAAIFINPLNTKEITESIENLHRNESLVGEMKQRGLERAAQFTWKAADTQLVEAIRDLNRGIIG